MDSFRIFILALIVIVLICLIRTINGKRVKSKEANQHPNRRIKQNGGIVTHPEIKRSYPDYGAPSPFCDDPCFSKPMKKDREANHAFRMLRLQYDTVIKRHNRMSARIRRVNMAAKEFNDISGSEMQEVIDLCKKDIQDAPDLVEYAIKWAALKGESVVYYPSYESFKRLAVIYEKQGKYEEAIDVCEQAIRLGLDNYDSKVSLEKKRKQLIELADKKSKQTNPVVSTEELPVKENATTNTTREELQAYEIIRSMATELKLQDRIAYKDTKSYLAVLMDGNVRAWICRLRLETGTRWITFRPQKDGKEENARINNIEDLYQYRKKLVTIMRELA